MKIHLLLIIITNFLTSLTTLSQSSNDPILLTIDKQNINLSEFKNIYFKNNNVQSADHKTKEEYLDLFINYKLKVLEAELLGLDTTSSFKKELSGYQKQLAQPYLTDSELNDSIIVEAYNRLKFDINASHILVKIGLDASAEDSIKAYNKIIELRKRITKNNESFETIVKEIQAINDQSIIAENLGYFTAFNMIYSFESMAYKTPIGKISLPVRTSYGYHIIKVNDKRPAAGQVEVAHLMIKSNDKSTEDEKINAQKKIQELYDQLKNGESFEKMAQQFSDDKSTAKNGGLLKPFGPGRMVPEFETACFNLEKVGDISPPFLSQNGWHIVKLISKKQLLTFEQEKNALKEKVKKDKRGLQSREVFVEKLKLLYNFSLNTSSYDEFVKLVHIEDIQSSFTNEKFNNLNGLLFSLHDLKFSKSSLEISQNEFIRFLKSNTKPSNHSPENIKYYLDNSLNIFINNKILEFEESLLMTKHLEYKLLLKEYRDGILLFNLMDQKIWSKAINDSTGLQNFYLENKSKFIWPDRIEGQIYTFNSEDLANKAVKLLKSKSTPEIVLAEFNKETQLNAKLDNGVFSKEDQPILDTFKWKKGVSKVMPFNNSFYVVNINKTLIQEPKTFENAKGFITSEYQNYLEKEWINSLKLAHEIKINHDVLNLIK